MSLTCTTCPYCGVGCGVLAGADGTIKGDPDHPANFGRLCSKGSALGETIDLEGRLLAPQVNGAEAAWDSALDLVAEKFSAAIRDHGPDSVAFYVSGQLLTEDYYVANKLMKGYIGSANIDTNSRLCMASSVAGHKRAFGSDTVPGTYEDLEEAELIVLVGSNLAWCHPVLYQRIAAAKAARPSMKIINIDPRRTATSDLADLHLPIAPDGDAALFNLLLGHLAQSGAVDSAYVAQHVDGFDAALSAASATRAEQTGLDPADLQAFLDLWTRTEKTVTIYSQGVNQSSGGTDKVGAILNCHLATGRIGKPGMGPFSVTGQPNAMGGREVGGLANMLGWHLDIENESHRAAVQTAWNSPAISTQPGLKAVDLFNACAEGRIKALWVMSTNPAVSMPNAGGVAEAIKNVPFTVVSDIMARTDTGDLADVLLPAAGWGEKSGTVTNSERRISRQRRFLPVPGQARPDWQIICQVAQRMGFDGFDFADEAAVFDEYAGLSVLARDAGRDFDITGLAGLTRAEYEALQPVQWPVPETGKAGGRFFASGNFYHAGGKAKMLPITPPEATAQKGLRLNSGRIRDQWHTMTRTAKSARLSAHLAEPYVEMHPEDALALGLRDADIARITSPQGESLQRVLITGDAQKGSVFAPMHWTRQFAGASLANLSVAPVTDPFSGQPALKGSAVEVSRFAAAWYGFLATQTQPTPSAAYSAIARTETGWQVELAGDTKPGSWTAIALQTADIAAEEAEIIQMHDSATGTGRIAVTQQGTLAALGFFAQDPVRLSRRYVTSLIGTQTEPQIALAGIPGAGRVDPGPIVCSCLNVGLTALRSAIADGAGTVEALGECTLAGTNCGSCKPELAALISRSTPKVAAE